MFNNLQIDIFLVQFWGMFIFVLSLIYLLKGKRGINELLEFSENKSWVSLVGYLALILGLTSINLCNNWTNDWRLLVTLFGWLSLLKGIFLLAFPRWVSKIVNFYRHQTILIVAGLILALIFSFWLIWVSGTYLPGA